MPVQKEIRKKANIYFFSKVVFNALLIVLGAVLIALFLRHMQHKTALTKQRENSEQALAEAVSILEKNAEDAAELTRVYHDANQDMLDDLKELLSSGLFDSLATADAATRSEVFADMVERSGVDYLFIMSDDGKALLSPYEDYTNADLAALGLLTENNIALLRRGTREDDGSVTPAMENNSYGYFYFYSERIAYGPSEFCVVLGADAATLDIQIDSLKDVSVVLSRTAIGNNGFLFAVNPADGSFIYYKNGEEVLTGQSALEAGLSEAALEDGYAGIQTINGIRYYCVSRTVGGQTVVCAVADTKEIFASDKYVLFWSDTGFILVMLLCLTYAVIVRNDFVRHEVKTDKRIFYRKKGSPVIFDRSIFRKVFPLTVLGVLLIFGISFYTQTLLEISEGIESSVVALDEVSGRYEESLYNRDIIKEYYNRRFLSKARLISYLLEEDPSLLNETSERYHSYYDEDGNKHFLTDDEGNRLKSIAFSARLQELCDKNDIESIYVYDEDGHTIATNTENWFFTISHDPADQSYPFLQVLDGKTDAYVQEPMTNDLGESGQYVGVAFTYYTTRGLDGETLYVSHYANEFAVSALDLAEFAGLEDLSQLTDEADIAAAAEGEEIAAQAEDIFAAAAANTAEEETAETAEEDELSEEELAGTGITAHRAMIQLGLDANLSKKLLASTELSYVFSSDMLKGGFIVLFDASPEHVCLYSPYESSVGLTAEELGVSPKAFAAGDYYGFVRVNGVTYFQYFRYSEGYYVATAIPRSGMYQARGTISVITALTSLVLILVLSLTVTLTTEEEEMLYATMSEEQEQMGLDAKIFSIILPSGRRTSTVKAAARWDNSHIPWDEKAPEQKLQVLIGGLCALLILYVVISVLGVNTIFQDGSIIKYILSGDWDKGPNIFAFSACALVLVFTSIAVALFRIPVRILTSILGTRSETIGHLLLSIVKYGGAIGAIFYCLYLLGLDATGLIASASILSLVIGLGAQSLIKDILAGIFIVFEGEFRVGDIVTIASYRGTVMDIGLRTTKIMGVDGNIKIFNNSDISGVLNMTKEASVAASTISIEYGQDIDYVEAVLARELPALKEDNPKILDGPTYLGVSALGASGVDLTVICKCFETDVKGVSRYMNREILKIFYRNNINVPFPNVTISQLDPSGRKTIKDLEEEEETARAKLVEDSADRESAAAEK
ncbi:MAG: mechanosensitive ion channel [Oscillospiraceae bacterium]|nr:mechanosensitive ion channel [Oscillospiraceae bacterium]